MYNNKVITGDFIFPNSCLLGKGGRVKEEREVIAERKQIQIIHSPNKQF